MYKVEVIEAKGSCNNSLFTKMAKNGDITAIKVNEISAQNVTITGFAKCHISTDNASFDITYYDTEEYGLISSGSKIFEKSVETYIDEVSNFRLSEIKTKKGKTYKAVPILKKEETTNKKEETTNNDDIDLPF